MVHDVALQKLPVRFAMDRAGLVGEDGPTHAGAYDVTFMACLPDMVVMAPSSEAELCHMIATSLAYDEGPSCFRYPRGAGVGVDMEAEGVVFAEPGLEGQVLPIGKGRILESGTDVALLEHGGVHQPVPGGGGGRCARWGVSVTVADARFCKPLDTELVRDLAKNHGALVTVEEGSIGGFASHVLQFLALDGLLGGNLKVRPIARLRTCPSTRGNLRQADHDGAELSASHIASTALSLMGQKAEAMEVLAAVTSKSELGESRDHRGRARTREARGARSTAYISSKHDRLPVSEKKRTKKKKIITVLSDLPARFARGL